MIVERDSQMRLAWIGRAFSPIFRNSIRNCSCEAKKSCNWGEKRYLAAGYVICALGRSFVIFRGRPLFREISDLEDVALQNVIILKGRKYSTVEHWGKEKIEEGLQLLFQILLISSLLAVTFYWIKKGYFYRNSDIAYGRPRMLFPGDLCSISLVLAFFVLLEWTKNL